MTKKRLFDDIRQNPARIYRTPGDVLRDRRFDDSGGPGANLPAETKSRR